MNIQTSTIRVPKNVLESIKIYCRKSGQPIGEWVETAWSFIEKNDFDIYDTEATPSITVQDIEKQQSQVEILCKLMTEVLTRQQHIAQLPAPDVIAAEAEAKAKAEIELKAARQEIDRLRSEVEGLKSYKEKAHRELCRVRDEQRVFGKIKVVTELD